MITKEMVWNLDNVVIMMNSFSALFIGLFAITIESYKYGLNMYGGLNVWIGITVISALLALYFIVEYGRIIYKMKKLVD